MAEPNDTVILTLTVSRANLIEALIRAGGDSDEFMTVALATEPDDELRLWAENYLFGFEPLGVRPNIVFT